MEHTKLFLKFLEETLNFDTPDEILNDLIKFQTFLITTRQDSEIKSARFHFNWKNYFINGSKLKQIENDYNYKNLVIEHDQILWGYKTIWYGRQSKSYKLHPEALEEGKIITVEN